MGPAEAPGKSAQAEQVQSFACAIRAGADQKTGHGSHEIRQAEETGSRQRSVQTIHEEQRDLRCGGRGSDSSSSRLSTLQWKILVITIAQAAVE